MLNLTTNANEVLLQVEADLKRHDENAARALQLGIFAATALVSNRIKQNGTNTAGQRMMSQRGGGVYSPLYAKYRNKKGRQTAHVDLWLTGDLSNAFQVIEVSQKQATAGFLNQTEATKAEYLEAYYGEIWGLQTDEQNDVIETILNEIL